LQRALRAAIDDLDDSKKEKDKEDMKGAVTGLQKALDTLLPKK
jgi:hypothetical protein